MVTMYIRLAFAREASRLCAETPKGKKSDHHYPINKKLEGLVRALQGYCGYCGYWPRRYRTCKGSVRLELAASDIDPVLRVCTISISKFAGVSGYMSPKDVGDSKV